MIHATDLAPWPRLHDHDENWTVHFSRGDGSSLFIVFCCWMTRNKSIAQTIRNMSEELAAIGIEKTLEKHFEGRVIDETEAKLLENLQEIVRMSWHMEE